MRSREMIRGALHTLSNSAVVVLLGYAARA
jgi:hypothetical protein